MAPGSVNRPLDRTEIRPNDTTARKTVREPAQPPGSEPPGPPQERRGAGGILGGQDSAASKSLPPKTLTQMNEAQSLVPKLQDLYNSPKLLEAVL